MKIFENSSLKQFIKFCLVGVSGTMIDWIFYFILTRWLGTYYLFAKAISFVIAATNNYIWNRVWTFRSQDKKITQQFFKFFFVSLLGLGFNTLIMYLIVERIGWSDIWGLFIATLLVMFWNFFINKFWTFQETT